MQTVSDLLEYLADHGGSVIDLENGVADFGSKLTDAAEDAGLIRVSRGVGMSVQDEYALTDKGWRQLGREKPPSRTARLLRAVSSAVFKTAS